MRANQFLQQLHRRLPLLDTYQGLLLRIAIAAGYFIAPNPTWAMVFYLGVLPSSGRLMGRRDGWPRDAGGIVGVALILWFTLATAWDEAAGPHIGIHILWIFNGLCTLVFYLGSRAAFRHPEERDKLLLLLLACALGNAALSLALYFHAPVLRMGGWAETGQPILGAGIIAVSVVLGFGMILQRRLMLLSGATVIVGLFFIVMTNSRGPLLSVVGSLLFLVAATRPRWLKYAAAAGAVAAVVFLVLEPGWGHDVWEQLSARGWSHRLAIWQLSLHEIVKRPILGYGPSARIGRPDEDFPHNLFLSTEFYAGAVGLILLLALLGLAARSAMRVPVREERLTLLALLIGIVLTGMTDLSVVIKGPSPMWYLVWIPVILAQTAPIARRRMPPVGGWPPSS